MLFCADIEYVGSRIILADNQEIYRAGAAKVLVREESLLVVAQCPDLVRLLQAVDQHLNATVVFASTLHPPYETMMDRLALANSKAVVIAEAGESPGTYLDQRIQGILYRDATCREMVECVQRVIRGAVFPHTGPLSEIETAGKRVLGRLTQKELRVAGLLIQGMRNKAIAEQCGTTEQVIKNYLRTVMDECGVSDRLELALYILDHQALAAAARIAAARPLVKNGVSH